MTSEHHTNIVIGSGIAGISAAYHLKKNNENCIIFEKDSDWGGLCGFFVINGFRFDRFVHFSFASNKETAQIFSDSSEMFAHPSISSNYYKGFWLKHPAQNNLYPLPIAEKVQIINDFVSRPIKEFENIQNYGEWLRVQYGKYFAENFPYKYTRKYWGIEPEKLETKWVGARMYSPNLKQVLNGAFQEQEENFYYTKFMNYPKKGGFRSILNNCRKDLDIRFNEKVVKIDPINKKVFLEKGDEVTYDNLVSTLPLPEIVKMLPNVPKEVIEACSKLKCTCGYQISLGFNKPDIAKYLWFYIYDEDILPARIYSPNLKSSDNVPKGCSSLQAEVFYQRGSQIPDSEVILDKTLEKLKKICNFSDEDIIVKDIRFEPYANVIFTHDIYTSRKTVIDYLNSINIKSIGRFGKWDYLWSHQAFESYY